MQEYEAVVVINYTSYIFICSLNSYLNITHSHSWLEGLLRTGRSGGAYFISIGKENKATLCNVIQQLSSSHSPLANTTQLLVARWSVYDCTSLSWRALTVDVSCCTKKHAAKCEVIHWFKLASFKPMKQKTKVEKRFQFFWLFCFYSGGFGPDFLLLCSSFLPTVLL